MTPTTDTLDDLLGNPPTDEEKAAVALSKTGGEPTITPEQARIAELEAQIAALQAPAEGEEKSAEQKAKEHAAALAATKRFDSAQEVFDTTSGDDDIVIHILRDGATFAGRVWYLGQTVRFPRGGSAYEETRDRNGVSWLDDLSDEAQIRRYGKLLFGVGPWTGPAFNDALAEEDRKRGDAVPVTLLK